MSRSRRFEPRALTPTVRRCRCLPCPGPLADPNPSWRQVAPTPEPPPLGAALGCLPALGSLVVHDVTAQLLFADPPPAELARLTRLTHLHWTVYGSDEVPGGLPPGGWQASVRRLALEERLLHASRGWLEGAAGLQELTIKWAPYPGAWGTA